MPAHTSERPSLRAIRGARPSSMSVIQNMIHCNCVATIRGSPLVVIVANLIIIIIIIIIISIVNTIFIIISITIIILHNRHHHPRVTRATPRKLTGNQDTLATSGANT